MHKERVTMLEEENELNNRLAELSMCERYWDKKIEKERKKPWMKLRQIEDEGKLALAEGSYYLTYLPSGTSTRRNTILEKSLSIFDWNTTAVVFEFYGLLLTYRQRGKEGQFIPLTALNRRYVPK